MVVPAEEAIRFDETVFGAIDENPGYPLLRFIMEETHSEIRCRSKAVKQ